jgi:hypothetical protein
VVTPILIGVYIPAVRAESPQLIPVDRSGRGKIRPWHRSNQGPPHARLRFAPRPTECSGFSRGMRISRLCVEVANDLRLLPLFVRVLRLVPGALAELWD